MDPHTEAICLPQHQAFTPLDHKTTPRATSLEVIRDLSHQLQVRQVLIFHGILRSFTLPGHKTMHRPIQDMHRMVAL